MKDSKNNHLWHFFAITYAWTWFFWGLEALAANGILDPKSLPEVITGPRNPAAWGPLIAAVVLTFLKGRSKDVVKLLKRALEVRFNKLWLLPALLMMPAVTGLSLLFAALVSGESVTFPWLSNPLGLLIGEGSFFGLLVFGGPLQEEFGWRGYALPRLQERYSALKSSVIVGTLWGFWHTPYFWIGTEVIYRRQIWGLVMSCILISIIMTWLYNNTKGSLLVMLLFHTSFNFAMTIFPAIELDMGGLFYIIFVILIPVLIVAFYGAETLARDKGKLTVNS